MKRFAKLVILILALSCLCACGNNSVQDWGSFTADKTYSYDEKYYVVQQVVEESGISNIEVTIYLTRTNEKVYSFTPARASDFWGVCWENDSYNIWVQSADIGVLCFAYDGQTWFLDITATCPDYIESKYD